MGLNGLSQGRASGRPTALGLSHALRLLPRSTPARPALVNISDCEAYYYYGPEGDITADAVRSRLADFEAGTVERKEGGEGPVHPRP